MMSSYRVVIPSFSASTARCLSSSPLMPERSSAGIAAPFVVVSRTSRHRHRCRDAARGSGAVSSRVPLVFLFRLEADYRAGLSAAVQPEGGGELVYRVRDSARGHLVREFDAGLIGAPPALQGERVGGKL